MLKVGITKQMDSFRLQVGLQVDNQVLALFGPSGSGKSMTLQCIAGLMTPDQGRIEIDGCAVFDSDCRVNLPPQRRRVGYVLQEYALFPHLTVGKNIIYGLKGITREEQRERVDEIIRTVRLEGLEERYPGELSGGQRQRVALARALVTRPRALLLDEPFAALDTAIRSRLHRELLQLLLELSIPTILVTHNLDEAYALSKEIAVCESGRVLQCGPREEVYFQPKNKAVARFMGVKNFWPGTVVEVNRGFSRIAGPGFEVWAPPGSYYPGQPVECYIRPEHVMLVPRDRQNGPRDPGETVLSGQIVEEVGYGGHYTLLFRPEIDSPGTRVKTDLHISLPAYIYQRLKVDKHQKWQVVLKQQYIGILEDTA